MSKFGKDELGTRMKENYENRSKTSLMRRCPVAIRVDGKAFHTFTEGFSLPFDDLFRGAMKDTMKYLCENVQGCVFGYTQSDEITLILADYQELDTSAWFDYEVQKVCSISAAMATMAFNRSFSERAERFLDDFYDRWNRSKEEEKLADSYQKALEKGAMFDARCFNIPEAEVTNLVYWRQLDASKNSVSQSARTYFSHKELDGKNSSERQDMLMEKKGINWNNYPTEYKRGSACVKENGKWVVDTEIPIFKGEGRDYVEKRIHFGEEKRKEKQEETSGKTEEPVMYESTTGLPKILPYSDGSVKTFLFDKEHDNARVVEIYMDHMPSSEKFDYEAMQRRCAIALSEEKSPDRKALGNNVAYGLFIAYEIPLEKMTKRVEKAFGKIGTHFQDFIKVVSGTYADTFPGEGSVLVSFDLEKFEQKFGKILKEESEKLETASEQNEEEEMEER